MKLHPMLMFKGNAVDALEQYANALPAAKISDKRVRDDGTIESANLLFGNNQLLMIDSPIDQPSISPPLFRCLFFLKIPSAWTWLMNVSRKTARSLWSLANMTLQSGMLGN